MKKLRKNKFVLLAVCVTIVSILYFIAQKAIDNYSFKMNKEIVSENNYENSQNEALSDNNTSVLRDSETQREFNEKAVEEDGEISNEETNLVVEEVEGDSTENEKTENSANELDVQDKIYVYITGEINNPGVVILNEGSRIVDAINAAGGTTAKANVSKVNLVYVLDDGMKVNIPNDDDLKNNSDFEYITMNSGDGRNDHYSNGNWPGGVSGGSEESSSLDNFKNYSVVNINTATQTELETLPGIGPSLALNIINYRKENGKFSSIDEIKNVSGIGDAKFETMKSLITV